jgi:putative transposase
VRTRGLSSLSPTIDKVLGELANVKRCRAHKPRNVLEQLPTGQHAQPKWEMNAVKKVDAKHGMNMLRKQSNGGRPTKLARWHHC